MSNRRGEWTSAEKRAILETVKEDARNEGRRDALVNVKKYIREHASDAAGATACRLVDEFMSLTFGPGL